MTSRRNITSSSETQAAPRTPSWEPRTSHANGHLAVPNSPSTNQFDTDGDLPPSLQPPKDPTRSPASLALHAHLLGLILGLSTLTSLNAAQQSNALWRLPFFLATLSLFHSLEYYTTALYNPESATTAAFLLNNGRAYNIAHLLAFLECFLHQKYFSYIHIIPGLNDSHERTEHWMARWWLFTGFILLGIGQVVRTMAMAHAGRNFNHIVQSRRKDGHVLVTDGLYKWLRHPSYFGFFWWGLGTQIVLGNVVCLVGYAVVLWRFFRRRIDSEFSRFFTRAILIGGLGCNGQGWSLMVLTEEEEFLIGFFGDDYVQYRRRTRVSIPFIS